MIAKATRSHGPGRQELRKNLDFDPGTEPIMPLKAPAYRALCEADRQAGRPASKTESRWCSMMAALAVVWGALTLALIVLLIYRGTLTMHEDDQLFLDSAEDHMQKEQEELLGKMERLTPWVRICGAGSAVLLVVMAGVYLFTHMTQ